MLVYAHTQKTDRSRAMDIRNQLVNGLKEFGPEYVRSEFPECEDDEVTLSANPLFSIQVGSNYIGLSKWVDNGNAIMDCGYWDICPHTAKDVVSNIKANLVKYEAAA